MLKVCDYLWDHADLIDCTEYGTAVKILLQHSQEHSWKFQSRAEALQTHFEGSPDFGAENPIKQNFLVLTITPPFLLSKDSVNI
jgi:hypothetical protein